MSDLCMVPGCTSLDPGEFITEGGDLACRHHSLIDRARVQVQALASKGVPTAPAADVRTFARAAAGHRGTPSAQQGDKRPLLLTDAASLDKPLSVAPRRSRA